MKRINWTMPGRIILAIALVGLLALGLTGRALAAEFRTGDTAIIAADEVIDDDLFIAGSRVEMNGAVKGDLFAAGQDVVINGTVEGSVFAGAQSVTINGVVAGSVFAGAYAVKLEPAAKIGRNVYFGGFSLTAEEGSAIGRGVYAGGYQAVLDGAVANDVEAGLAAFELNGSVGGDVNVQVDRPDPGFDPSAFQFFPFAPPVDVIAPGLHLGEGAQIGGGLKYVSPEEQTPPSGVVSGPVVYATPAPGQGPDAARGPVVSIGADLEVGRRVGEFLALLIVGGVLLRYAPNWVESVSKQIRERPAASGGWGLLVTIIVVVGVPVAVILLLLVAAVGGLLTFGHLFGRILNLGGATLALAVTAFTFTLALVTKVVVAQLVGHQVLARTSAQTLTGKWGGFWALVVGALLYELLRWIPFVGWLMAVVVTLIGAGAIYFVLRDSLRRAPPAVMAPPAPMAA